MGVGHRSPTDYFVRAAQRQIARLADQVGEVVDFGPGEMLREASAHGLIPCPIRRPVRHDVNLACAAFLTDESSRLRKIDESEARGRADRFERHNRIVLAGAVQTPYARGLDALGAEIGDRRRGGVHEARIARERCA